MSLNAVKFRLEGDGSSLFRTQEKAKQGFRELQDVVAKEVTGRLKQAFSVVAIEEMVRKTAEWATQLTNTAKHLQVTTQELQGFQIAGSRIGMDSGKIEGFFGTMEDGAREALKGNMELLKSFKNLGIGMDELRNKAPAQLFERVLSGLKTEKFGVQGSQEIFGRGDTIELQRLSNVMGGQTGAGYADKSGLAAGDKDLQEITVAWRSVTEGFKSLAVELTPFVKVILSIVTALMSIVKGVFGTITGMIGDLGTAAGQFSAGDWKGGLKTLGKMTLGRITNVGSGIAKAATFGFADKAIDEWMEPGNKMLHQWGMGLNEKERQHSEGVGEGIGTILMGEGVGRGLGAGERGIRGMAANRATSIADKYAQSLGYEDLLEMRAASQAGKQMVTGTPNFRIPKASEMFELDKLETSKLAQFGMKEHGFVGATKFSSKLAQAGQLAGLGGVGTAEINKRMGEAGELPFAGRNPFLNVGGGFGAGGGGGANLKIGGVFGTDVSFKIMTLNQQMAADLSRIVTLLSEDRNTSTVTVPLH